MLCVLQTCVTFFVGMTVGRSISNDFSYIGAPFLMGTVALGMCWKIQNCAMQCSTYRTIQHIALWLHWASLPHGDICSRYVFYSNSKNDNNEVLIKCEPLVLPELGMLYRRKQKKIRLEQYKSNNKLLRPWTVHQQIHHTHTHTHTHTHRASQMR